jgi:hypothetical protein
LHFINHILCVLLITAIRWRMKVILSFLCNFWPTN